MVKRTHVDAVNIYVDWGFEEAYNLGVNIVKGQWRSGLALQALVSWQDTEVTENETLQASSRWGMGRGVVVMNTSQMNAE